MYDYISLMAEPNDFRASIDNRLLNEELIFKFLKNIVYEEKTLILFHQILNVMEFKVPP